MGRKFYKQMQVLGIILLGVFFSNYPLAQGAERTIKIGMSAALSGPAAGWGLPWVRATQILVDEINKGGLKYGGDEYKIELVVYDDKRSGSEAAIVARKLVEDDKVIVACHHGGDPPLAARSILGKAGVLHWGTPYDRRYPSPDYPLNFASFIRYVEAESAAYAWLLKTYPNVKKVAQISPNNASGKGGTDLIKHDYPGLGIDLVSTDLFELGTTDFTPILMKVIRAGVDLISLVGAAPQACGLIVKQAREIGYKGLFMHYYSTDPAVISEIAGPEFAEGFISVGTTGEPYSPEEKKFIEKYVAKYGGPFPDFALVSCVNNQVLLEAIKSAPEPTPKAIAETMWAAKTPTLNTLWGKAYFVGKDYYGIDNQFIVPIPVSTVRQGKTTLLTRLPFEGFKAKPFE